MQATLTAIDFSFLLYAVLHPVPEVGIKATSVTLCDNFHAYNTLGCQENRSQLLVQPKMVGCTIKEKTDGV